MTLTALVLELDAACAERLSDALLELGALSVTFEDARAVTAAEVPCEPGESPTWQRVKLTALWRAQDDPERRLFRACETVGLSVPLHGLRSVPDGDWIAKSKVVLDPGLAFGTGDHPSTRLCLQWLDRTIGGGETVLDYGCGSGILAIAALKLGARRAVGVDIDPDAVAAARANARRNGVEGQFLDGLAPLAFTADVVVANILANPLKLLAPLLASRIRRGGRLALSGILPDQASEIEKCYAPWIEFAPCTESEGWACLSGVRL